MAIYNYEGNTVSVNADALNYDFTVRAIAHRGYSQDAPENTLPAYKLAKQRGFNYAECDISLTSDGKAVLLHDDSIDRTSNGTGYIGEMTLAQVRTYDFGSWKNAAYTGTQIPTFEEFIALCKNIGIHPYIELKRETTHRAALTQAQVQGLVDVAHAYGMRGKCTWISFDNTVLGYVKSYDASERLGFLSSTVSAASITTANALKTTTNEVVIDAGSSTATECNLCIAAGLPLERYTLNSEQGILDLNPYVSGVTSNFLIAGQVLYNNYIS